MRKTAVCSILIVISLVTGASAQVRTAQKPESLLNSLPGRWVYDLDFVAEYLERGSEIQKQWCGHGWSDKEIQRRERLIKERAYPGNPLLVWDFDEVRDGSVDLRTENSAGERGEKRLHDCHFVESQILVCRDSSSPSPFAMRLAGQHLFAMVKITPAMMSCELVSVSPPELWIEVARLSRLDLRTEVEQLRTRLRESEAMRRNLEEALALADERLAFHESLAREQRLLDEAGATIWNGQQEELQNRLDAGSNEERVADPESTRFVAIGHRRRIESAVTHNWRRPPGTARGLKCMVEVEYDSYGQVLRVEIVESSGNPAFDRSVEEAVFNSSPLPIHGEHAVQCPMFCTPRAHPRVRFGFTGD